MEIMEFCLSWHQGRCPFFSFIEGGTRNFAIDGEKSILKWEVIEQEAKLDIEGKDILTDSSINDEKDVQRWTNLKEDWFTENTNSFY